MKQNIWGVIFNEISKAVAIGDGRVVIKPWISLALLSLGSIVALFLDNIFLFIVVITEIILILILQGFRVVLRIIFLFSIFSSYFIIAGAVIQYVLLKYIDTFILLNNLLRMFSLVCLSYLVMSHTRINDLLMFLAKISPSLALAMSLSLKNFSLIFLSLKNMYEVYLINYKRSNKNDGIFSYITDIISLVKGIIYYSVYLNIYTLEALLSRYYNIIIAYHRRDYAFRAKEESA